MTVLQDEAEAAIPPGAEAKRAAGPTAGEDTKVGSDPKPATAGETHEPVLLTNPTAVRRFRLVLRDDEHELEAQVSPDMHRRTPQMSLACGLKPLRILEHSPAQSWSEICCCPRLMLA